MSFLFFLLSLATRQRTEVVESRDSCLPFYLFGKPFSMHNKQTCPCNTESNDTAPSRSVDEDFATSCCAEPFSSNHPTNRLFLLAALVLLLENLLDNLLLLDKERADDAVPDAVTASRATVRPLDGLLGLGDVGVLAGAQSRDL